MAWKLASDVVQRWGQVQMKNGLSTQLDELWGSGQYQQIFQHIRRLLTTQANVNESKIAIYLIFTDS